ncbi:MAG: tail fiber domain-containing protein [Verrucomicrobia bacterium]|nr:tail fiber domain-containing protein [Verrucomicrobiota bacterium]
MKKNFLALALLGGLFVATSAFSQSTAFTYQGRLNDNGIPAGGIYDLRFTLHDAVSGGIQQGNGLTNSATVVSDGLFTATLDFGNQFPGADRWLEIGVRTNGGTSFHTLSPRQSLTTTPYAVYATGATTATIAGSANSVAAANITGALTAAQLPASVLTNGAIGVTISGNFSGNGSGVTNVNVRSLQTLEVPVVAWGGNSFGQTIAPAFPSDVAAIAAGGWHSLALRSDGTVAAWGAGITDTETFQDYGQAIVPAGLNTVEAIAAGLYHSLALRSDGTVAAWGLNVYDILNVPAGLNNVVSIAGGGFHSLALKNDGTVTGWGLGMNAGNPPGYGQAMAPEGLSNVVAIAAGMFHSLALRSNGTVVAWGQNDQGQTNVPAGLSNVVAIAGGGEHSMALKSDGTLAVWGGNGYGLITNNAVNLSNVVAIAAGYYHSMALQSDGTVTAWGSPVEGQSSVPAGLGNVVAISAGGFHNLVLRNQQEIPAQVALLTENAVFQSAVTATRFIGDGSGLSGVALLDSPNTFSMKQSLNFGLDLNGPFTAMGKFRLYSAFGSGFSGEAFVQAEDDSGFSSIDLVLGSQLVGVASEALRITSAGNIGIGTNAPTEKLEVRGNVRASGTFIGDGSGLTNLNLPNLTSVDDALLSANVALRSGGNSFSGDQIVTSGIFIGDGSGLTNLNLPILTSVDDALLSANVALRSGGNSFSGDQIVTSGTFIGDGSGLTNLNLPNLTSVDDTLLSTNVALRTGGNTFTGNQIITNGNVGIGTATPGTRLTVATPESSYGIEHTDGTRRLSTFLAGDGAWLGTTSPDPLHFYVNDGSNALTINTNGRVGIGTTNPGKALQIGESTTGSEGMIRLTSRTSSGGPVGRTWDIGVPQTGDIATGNGYSFVINDTGLGTNSQFLVQWGTGNVGIGTNNPSQRLHVVGNILATGTITPSSDRNLKKNFATVDAREVLEAVVALPIQQWTYKAEADAVRHFGPMAQDFHAAFGLGADDVTIATVDADGVALAAIQGLNQKLEETRTENAELKRELSELKKLVHQLDQAQRRRK